jgi:sterol desaturase/sphingolipid hydroxylase (fatty acid hydroxylase superfamily)
MRELMLSAGQDLQVYLFFGFLGAFLIAERVVPKRKPRNARARRWLTNAALTTVVILSLPLLPVSFITAAYWGQKNGIGLFNLIGEGMPLAVLVTLTLLVRGFISFGTHYLNHKVPFLWRFHRVHHLDTELDVSTTVRFHPLEMAISLVLGLPVVLLFGLSPWVLIFYELLDVSVTLFSHANIRLAPWLARHLRYFIVTPDLHKVHHSTYQPETDSNFSAVFPIWDILLGTFRTETREPLETMAIGLEDVRDPQANSFWWLLASPFLPTHRRRTAIQAPQRT